MRNDIPNMRDAYDSLNHQAQARGEEEKREVEPPVLKSVTDYDNQSPIERPVGEAASPKPSNVGPVETQEMESLARLYDQIRAIHKVLQPEKDHELAQDFDRHI